MRKKISILILLSGVILLNINSQNDFFKYLANNKIKLFYNYSADITIEKYADYYRIAQIDSSNLLFNGGFEDFTIKGNKIFSGKFIDGKLEGSCKYFYENGNIKEMGQFKSGIRDSTWIFYYPNKQIEKVVIFKNGIPYIKSSFSKKGNQLIKDGNGKYNGRFYKDNGKATKYYVRGELIDGKLNGKWVVSGITQEIFENGQFIEGYDVIKYTKPQQIYLENILGYYCHENLTHFQNKYFCKSCIDNISWALYNIKANINNSPYDSLLTKYKKIIDSLGILSFSQMIQFEVNNDGTIQNIKTHKSNNLINSNIIANLLESITWNPLQCDGNTFGYAYMMIIMQNGKMYLPQAMVITNNMEANYMVKQMSDNSLLICH